MNNLVTLLGMYPDIAFENGMFNNVFRLITGYFEKGLVGLDDLTVSYGGDGCRDGIEVKAPEKKVLCPGAFSNVTHENGHGDYTHDYDKKGFNSGLGPVDRSGIPVEEKIW